jgi:hypothetical protein
LTLIERGGLYGWPTGGSSGYDLHVGKFRFEHQIIDTSLSGIDWAQTVAADLDRDGRPEFMLGQRLGNLYWYDWLEGKWTRRLLGENSPSDVGAAAMDVDGDGWIDIVAGGAWYRNSRDPDRPFERFVFDPELTAAHDIVVADIDHDGKAELITMSDQNNLRFYRPSDDPTRAWARWDIFAAVHAGLAIGDIDGDGHLDIVRSDVWLENVDGDASKWVEHIIGQCGGETGWQANATRAVVCDMDRDGKIDVVMADAEIVGGRIFWMQNLDGRGRQWKRHDLPHADDDPRGAYHSLIVRDFDGDGDLDIFSCEMEWVRGQRTPRWFIWENLDRVGMSWREHVILDANLGGHEAVCADFDGDGQIDIIAKPWTAHPENALGGKMHVDWLRSLR